MTRHPGHHGHALHHAKGHGHAHLPHRLPLHLVKLHRLRKLKDVRKPRKHRYKLVRRAPNMRVSKG